MSRTTDFKGLIQALAVGRVDFIIIGGIAAAIHGSARTTFDLDVVYERSRPNLERLVRAVDPLEPYLRGAPPGLPFRFDVETLEHGLNFTLDTTRGSLDLLGEVVGGGTYPALLPQSEVVDLFGHACYLVSLDALIRLKRAAGRPKDLEVMAELEALRDATSGQ